MRRSAAASRPSPRVIAIARPCLARAPSLAPQRVGVELGRLPDFVAVGGRVGGRVRERVCACEGAWAER